MNQEQVQIMMNNIKKLANDHIIFCNDLIEKWNKFVLAEGNYKLLRQEFSDRLFSSEYLYEHIRKFCYASCDCFHVNRFSLHRLEMLENYYDDMCESMRVDADAFLKTQVKWLGRTFEEIDIISDKRPLTDDERAEAWSDIEVKLRKWLGKEMDEKARAVFCVEAKESLLKLLAETDSEEAKRYRDRIYHKELSGKCLAYIITELNLPFVFNVTKGHKVLENRP